MLILLRDETDVNFYWVLHTFHLSVSVSCHVIVSALDIQSRIALFLPVPADIIGNNSKTNRNVYVL